MPIISPANLNPPFACGVWGAVERLHSVERGPAPSPVIDNIRHMLGFLPDDWSVSFVSDSSLRLGKWPLIPFDVALSAGVFQAVAEL
jgi:hypothetical protein